MIITALSRYPYLLSALASFIVALPPPCIPDATIRSQLIPKAAPNCNNTNQNLATPAGPFPELYALPGLDLSAFIHVKYAWTPLTPPQIRNFHIVSRNLQLSIANNIRYHGDQKLPDKGFDKKVGRMEYWIHPIPSRRYEVRFSVAQAAIRAVTFLFRAYGFFEVEVGVHMFEYVEDRPDAYIVLVQEEDPPRADALRS